MANHVQREKQIYETIYREQLWKIQCLKETAYMLYSNYPMSKPKIKEPLLRKEETLDLKLEYRQLEDVKTC